MQRSSSFRLIATLATSAFGISTPLFAQPVSVSLESGVHVRAPYTSVDVFPGGGVRVRAPFTAVDVGGRATYTRRPHVARRPVTRTDFFTQDDLVRMSDAELWRAVRETSDRFMDCVSRFDTGVTWQRYLRLPDELQSAIEIGDGAQRDAVARLLLRFDEIAADSHYRKISNLPTFVAMRSALMEIAKRSTPSGPDKHTELLPAPRFESAPPESSQLPPPAKP